VWEGQWFEGERHGNGLLTLRDGSVVSGLWALQDFAAVTGSAPAPAPRLEPVHRSLKQGGLPT
jgi:hypothetical protein